MGLKVKKIEYEDEIEPAYDISVESDNHTFELENGVFVHNSMGVPKQYFGVTKDGAGFDGGKSLSIISARYAKMVKRIQNTIIQAITDAINLILLNDGLDNYINKFTLKMLPPTTQEEIDRREQSKNKIDWVGSIMDLLQDIDDPAMKLKMLKSLLANIISNTELMDLLQQRIDELEKDAQEAEDEVANAAGGNNASENSEESSETDFDMESPLGLNKPEPSMSSATPPTAPTKPSGQSDDDRLPSGSDLGVDLTDFM